MKRAGGKLIYKQSVVNGIFIAIGLAIGIILILQIHSGPVTFGSSNQEQIALRRELFQDFRVDQEQLSKKLEQFDERQQELESLLEQRTAKETRDKLQQLREITGFSNVQGVGVEITMNDNPTASRFDYSALNESFVQSADIRDAVNALFLQQAGAVSINGQRVTPLTPIRSAFDTIFIDNIQVAGPYVISALGNQDALEGALTYIRKNGIRVFVDRKSQIQIPARKLSIEVRYLTTTQK